MVESDFYTTPAGRQHFADTLTSIKVRKKPPPPCIRTRLHLPRQATVHGTNDARLRVCVRSTASRRVLCSTARPTTKEFTCPPSPAQRLHQLTCPFACPFAGDMASSPPSHPAHSLHMPDCLLLSELTPECVVVPKQQFRRPSRLFELRKCEFGHCLNRCNPAQMNRPCRTVSRSPVCLPQYDFRYDVSACLCQAVVYSQQAPRMRPPAHTVVRHVHRCRRASVRAGV